MRPTAAALRCFLALCILGLQAPAPAAETAPVFLEDLTWTELSEAVRAGHTTVLIPIGGTEQSGPALALGKHNVRVRLLCGRIAQELGNALVAPVIAYVPEGGVAPPSSHMRYPGTISVPPKVFEATLEAAARSLRAHGFRDIVLLGDHGGYQAELAPLAARLDREWAGEPTRVWAPPEYYAAASQGYAALLRARGFPDSEIGTHAALADTSMQLAADPGGVRGAVLHGSGPLDASVGVYGGDPRRASAELGQLGLDLIVRQSVGAITRLAASPRPSAAGGHATVPTP
jgi:creatinine amidohydrolase